ncbi:MAG: 4-oxalocrotonate tautomerase family protein [Alphaproteobacteria bacterium]|nr:4-oxalocrotonate tautomerase family protein [Alphaproteobacteria bacterium]
MAIVSITIIEGRDRETKNRLIARLTDAVVDTLGAEPGQVRVVINEVGDGDYAVAGKPVFLKGDGNG